MIMPAEPPVAVIMTCYNEGPYIGEAVRSVLDQTRSDLIREIVIADDGSDEDTRSSLRAIESWDPRVRVMYEPGGNGVPRQRCLAIAATSAPYLAILDGDDLWTPQKLELQVSMLDRRPDVGLVYGRFHTFPDGNIGGAQLAPTLDITGFENLSRTYFLNDPPIIPSTTLLRRTAYEASGGFDPDVRVFEDTDFFLRIASVTRFGFVNEPLLFKRNRRTSITGGRKDLMAHHAFVALKAAAKDSTLLPLVPKRLADRARKLANHQFIAGNPLEARALSALAVRLAPLSVGNWVSWALARAPAGLAGHLLRTIFARRVNTLPTGQSA
jgi:glycosyltransferase involved in cell wall biosynthesis